MAREAELLETGYQAYTTSVGWFGYSDAQIRGLCRDALADGWTHFKVKVGGPIEDDRRRIRLVREEIGPDCRLMIDANQRWDVGEAIARVQALAEFDLWWMEEPTSPDDVLGHAAIAKAIAPVARRHRRALREPRHVQAAAAGRGDSASARSTRAAWAASTRTWRCC